MFFFRETLNGQQSWARIFQRIEAFEPMVREIFRRHKLDCPGIQNLTPGTNAVFQCGERVVKLFAPLESGFQTADDFSIELQAMEAAAKAGVPTPEIYAADQFQDRYSFSYLIMGYIPGTEACHVLNTYSLEEKEQFSHQIKIILERLNRPLQTPVIPPVKPEDFTPGARWEQFPCSLRQDITDYARSYPGEELVLTHGDLTGENVLIQSNGAAAILDYADSRIAPRCYELPPLCFSLLEGDPILLRTVFSDWDPSKFLEELLLGTIIHEYGSPIAAELCDSVGISVQEIRSVHDLRCLLQRTLESGTSKIK